MIPSALSRVLAPGGLTSMYQPIYEIGAGGPALFALECLSRGPAGTNLEPAAVLFDYVRRKRAETAVDRACLMAAFREVQDFPPDARFSVNLHASTLRDDDGLADFLQRVLNGAGVPFSRLTIEILQYPPAASDHGLLAAVNSLRRLGARVALDNMGHGEPNLRLILNMQPDFLKIDRYFVQGCGSDPGRQAIIEVLALLALRFKIRVVAKGVEDEQSAALLTRYGVTLMQGFLYSEPLTSGQVTDRFSSLRSSAQLQTNELV